VTYAPPTRAFYDADSHIMELPDFLRDYADPSIREQIPQVSYSASLVTDEEVDAIVANGGRHTIEHVEAQIALGDALIASSKEIQALGAFDPGDRSTALDKGLIAIANLFADVQARATNQIVVAHELLHTLRATDKYSLASNAPSYPDGYAVPDARPLLPQTKAELMAGRIPLDERRAEMPSDLRQVVIGPATAREIGWRRLH